MRTLLLLGLILLALLAGCVGDSPIPGEPPTPGPTLTPGDVNCWRVAYPPGYNTINSNPCFQGEIHVNDLWDEYDIDDQRYEAWFGNEPVPVQRPGSIGVPAYINAGDYNDGVTGHGIRIEVTELDGYFGLQFGQDLQRGCYNLKAFVTIGLASARADIPLNLNLINLQGTIDAEGYSISTPYGGFVAGVDDYEFTWVFSIDDYTTSVVSVGVNVYQASFAGTVTFNELRMLRAPDNSCLPGVTVLMVQ